MTPYDKIKALEKKINDLTSERNTVQQVLEAAVSSAGFTSGLSRSIDIKTILEQTAARVRSFIRIKGVAFYLFSEDGLDFPCYYCDPDRFLPFIEREKEVLIEDHTIAWTIDRNRPIILSSSQNEEHILLHTIMSQGRSLGLLIGILDEDPSQILDISYAFLTVALNSTASILRDAEYYRLIQNLNEELKQKVAKLEQSEQQLELAVHAKDRFLANVSHEIRTPMNAILGMARLLLDSNLAEEPQEMTRIIFKEAESLLHLINDILDFSKIEAGKIEMERVPFSVNRLVKESLKGIQPLMEQKCIDLRLSIDKDVPPICVGDPSRIRQVLSNLLSNALKFTHKGYIALSISLPEDNGFTHKLAFRIEDTGVGIPENQFSKLFHSFTQIDASTSRKYGGTGLGLAIAKELIELMGGEIGVESRVGKGSVFWFTIPFEQVEDGSVEFVTEEEHFTDEVLPMQPLDKRFKILVVEDSETNRRVAVGFLNKIGCDVDAVESGKEALEALSQKTYDLILMDIQMPEMDGIETTQRIRMGFDDGTYRKIPIIAMTANAQASERERCLRDGLMDGYLTKPVMLHELSSVLRKNLRQKDKIVFHKERLLERLANDQNLLVEIIKSFRRDLPSLQKSLKEAIDKEDCQQISRVAHTLRGAALNVGADEIAYEAERLEKNEALSLSMEDVKKNWLEVDQAILIFMKGTEEPDYLLK